MQKYFFLLLILLGLNACSEVELGSHIAKSLAYPNDSEERVGDFKVGNPYKIKGRTYYPSEKYRHSETGVASWYGPGFHGKLTANGEKFNKRELTAAHKTLQMPSMVRVTNLDNGRSIIVRVNDRGPFAHDRVIDLSEKAAEIIGMKQAGTANVRIDLLEKESLQIASAARKGISTRGTEVTLNRGKKLGKNLKMDIATPTAKPTTYTPSIQTVAIQKDNNINQFNQILVKQVNASPIRKPMPTNQQIYIQAGAFSNEDNALTMSNALYNISEPVTIQRNVESTGVLYRVKIGPINSMSEANQILSNLTSQGRDAKIITAEK